MRKLRLDVEKLEVESFAVSPRTAPFGTVHGLMPNGGPLINDPGTSPEGGGDSQLVGPTLCGCGATGPSIPICIGPTYCGATCACLTAYSTCCNPPTDAATCPNTCFFSCYRDDCLSP
ncbi:MAG TPA: hypothetical protein VF092_07085 [Longimicrobium sp.]